MAISENIDILVNTVHQNAADIRTVQELLGHADVPITMVYIHALNKPGVTVTSRLDLL